MLRAIKKIWNNPEKGEEYQSKQALKDQLMTEEQKKLANKYIERYKNLYAENQDLFTLWDSCEAAYRGISSDYYDENEIERDAINIIHPNVEGQVSALVDQNIAAVVKGEGPSDQQFAATGKILIDWTLRKNHIKRIIRRHERRREKFGTSILKPFFDPDALRGFGLATITCPSLKRVFVDGKIKDFMRLQEGDYIIETMTKSKTWARKKYGKEKANAIFTGIDPETLEFSEKQQRDDDDSFTLLLCWSKEDGPLRMLEITGDGLLLYDSYEDENLQEEGEQKPYYKIDKYPYFFTPLYEIEGSLYGMGDAELLMVLQAIINDLDDQIVTGNRLNGNPRVFIDPDSEVDIEKLTNEEGQIIPANRPRENIYVVETKPVSEAVIRRKNEVFSEAQRQTRFSDLMIGQQGTSDTATEAMIQQQQGNSAIADKKMALQDTLNEVVEYLLSLMMEHYTEAKAFRIAEDKDDFQWIDPRQLNNIPMLKPATEGFIKEFQSNNPDAEPPQWEVLKDEEGNDVTKEVEFDIEISIGAGLPKNKAFLYQLVKELAVVQVQGVPILSYQEVRNFLKDYIDLPLEESEQQQAMVGPQVPGMQGGPVQPNYNVEGMTAGGNPMLGVLPNA